MTVNTNSIDTQVPVQTAWGTATSPSYSFTSDTNTGMYHPSPDVITFATNGVNRFEIQDTVIYSAALIRNADGTFPAPSYSFQSDPNTGIYHSGADSMGFVTGGVGRMIIDTDSINTNVPIQAASGTTTLPAYSFTSDTNTGIYQPTAETIGFVANGIETMRTTSYGTIHYNPLRIARTTDINVDLNNISEFPEVVTIDDSVNGGSSYGVNLKGTPRVGQVLILNINRTGTGQPTVFIRQDNGSDIQSVIVNGSAANPWERQGMVLLVSPNILNSWRGTKF